MGTHKFDGDINVTGSIYKDGILDVPCEETTYAALKAKRDAGELVPGRWYRITDFVTTVHSSLTTQTAGHRFDILVLALTPKTLSEEAKAARNVNDTSYFGTTEYVVVSATLKPGITIEDVVPMYKVSYDVSTYRTPREREREFTSIGTIMNSEGVTVPYLFEPDPDGDSNDRNYIYAGIFEFDGNTYDIWQEYDLAGNAYPYYELTNVIVDSVLNGTTVDKVRFSNWSLKYSLDNDTTRFSWATQEEAIINIESHCSNGIPLIRQPSFDNDGPAASEGYLYAWGTAADVSDPESDWSYFVFSQTEHINSGDTVWKNGQELIAEIGEAGKGVIYWLKDEWNNECSYDFKNMIFNLPNFRSYTFGYGNNNQTDNDASLLNGGSCCYDNIIGEYRLNGILQLNSTVFYSPEASPRTCLNTLGINNYNNHFGIDACNNIIGSNFAENSVGNNFRNNVIGNDCFGNTIGGNFGENVIGNVFRSNTIGDGFQYNIIGHSFQNNNFGHNCFHNIIGNTAAQNTVANSFAENFIGIGFQRNSIGNSFGHNNVGNEFHDNTIGRTVQYNIFGINFSYNGIGSVNQQIYVSYCLFDNDIKYISLTSDDTSASSSNRIKNVHIHSGVCGFSYQSKTISVPDRNLNYVIDYYPPSSEIIYV